MKKVLIIDDNPINNGKYISEVKKGYDTDTVLAMRSAIRMLESRTYDVVVIDVMMPTQILNTHNEMTAGFDFYETQIKNLCGNSKVIFWSRLTDSCFDRNKYNDTNKYSFVQKSDASDHLLKEINRILQQ